MPDIPKNAKQPQDHVTKDEAAAAKAEATGENFNIEFNGEEYEILVKRMNTIGFMELLERVDDGAFYVMPRLVKKILGDEAWARFMKSNHDDELDDVSGDAVAEFFDKVNETSGNQQASSGS